MTGDPEWKSPAGVARPDCRRASNCRSWTASRATRRAVRVNWTGCDGQYKEGAKGKTGKLYDVHHLHFELSKLMARKTVMLCPHLSWGHQHAARDARQAWDAWQSPASARGIRATRKQPVQARVTMYVWHS